MFIQFTERMKRLLQKRITRYIAAAVLSLLASCGQHNDSASSNTQLVDKIENAISSGDSVLDLDKVADFSWDSLLILNPYTHLDVVSAELNVDLSSAKESAIDQRDDINVLLFFANGQQVKLVEFPRISGDFADTTVRFVARDSAQYEIVETQQLNLAGRKSIELRRK